MSVSWIWLFFLCILCPSLAWEVATDVVSGLSIETDSYPFVSVAQKLGDPETETEILSYATAGGDGPSSSLNLFIKNYDDFYNSLNTTSSYTINIGEGKAVQTAVLVDGSTGVLLAAEKSRLHRFNFSKDSASLEEEEEQLVDNWVKWPEEPFSLGVFLTDPTNNYILIGEGKSVFVGRANSLNKISDKEGWSQVDDGELVRGAISEKYFVIGNKKSIYYGKTEDGKIEPLEVSLKGIDSYSLACNSNTVYFTYIKNESEELVIYTEVYELNDQFKSGSDSQSKQFHTTIHSKDGQGMKDWDSILNCISQPDSSQGVKVFHSSVADDSSLIVSLPKCKVGVSLGESSAYELSIEGYVNYYYSLSDSIENEVVPKTEDVSTSTYKITNTHESEISFYTLSAISGEVCVINGLNMLASSDEASVRINSVPLIRSCDRTTMSYPKCVPRSFMKEYGDGEEVLPGCPIKYDGYYCNRCGYRYAKSGGDDDNPECDKCSPAYFGARCSASVAGVICLTVVFLILICASIIGYIVNRK